MSRISIRDVVWIVLALILIGLICLERNRAGAIQAEIQKLKATDPPLRFENAELRAAVAFLIAVHHQNMKVDWKSLKSIGLSKGTTVTCTITPDTARADVQQLFGDQVEVLETPEGLVVRAKSTATPP